MVRNRKVQAQRLRPHRLGDGARRDGAAAREVPPDWWRRALLADRSPVEFVLCFATPATAIAVLDPPPFGIWRFEVPGGPPIGWRSASRGQPSVRATLFADAVMTALPTARPVAVNTALVCP